MDFNSQDSQEIMKNFKSIIGSRLEKLDNEKGADGELYAYSIAVANQKKKKAKETPQDITMENNRLREMVIDALTEKKKSSAFTPEYDDKFTDKRKDLPDGLQKSILKKQGKLDEAMISPDNRVDYLENALGHIWNMGRGNNNIDLKSMAQSLVNDMFDESLNEDLDLGHTDDEPHMIKAELAQIGKYAIELYKMVDQFEGEQEVDFPAWWQSKITTAKNMVSSAKHYLEFELKEPQIDAMVDVAAEEEAIGENMIDDISYRNSNNIMRGIYDLAKKSKDVESFKDKWYEIYSRGPQDKDADTDEWLEKTYTRVMSRVTTEEMTPEESRKKGMPFKNVTEEAIDEMSKKQIKKRGEIFDALVDKGMSKKKAGPIATSTAMKEAKAKIKEAILAKLKNK